MTGPAAAHRSTLILCLAIVYLVWGSSYLATRIGVGELPPLLMGGCRFVAGGLLLYGFARVTGRQRGVLDRREWQHLFWVGFGCVLLSNGFNAWGMQYVTSNQSALLNTSSAFWIVLLGMFGRRAEPITLRIGNALARGLLGTILLLSPGAAESPWPRYVPEIGVVLGCLGWAFGTIYMRNARSSLDLLSFTGLQMFVGGVMLLALGAASGELARWTWSPTCIAAMLWLMLFSSCIAYAAYAWLTAHATPAQVGSYAFVNPVVATALGWGVLGESLTSIQVAGMAIVLLALGLIHAAPARPDSPQSE